MSARFWARVNVQPTGCWLWTGAQVSRLITAHDAGYIDRDSEIIVGLQTDAPLKRAIMPNGGVRMVEGGLKAYGFRLDPTVAEIWSKYRKDHNSGVFDVYSPEIAKADRR